MTDSPDHSTEVSGRRAAREGAAGRAATASPIAGVQAVIAKHPTVWLFSAIGVVFLLLATGSLFAGIASGSGRAEMVPLPAGSEAPPRTQPSAVPAGTHLRTCSIASAAALPDLGTLAASVVNANTGEVLFDRAGATPAPTGSVLKILTAAAALKILGPSAQLSTKVIDGSSKGTIVLVGGGDPTLATVSNSFYEGAPLISDLATAAMAAYKLKHPGDPVTQIVLDSTLWSPSDNWDPSWPVSERADGYLGLVTALQVDGDRSDPTQAESARGEDPIGRAGQAFADAAGLENVTFTRGAAVGTTVLAEVKSQPLSTLIGQMLLTSDNTLAESIARVAAKTAGMDGGSASVGQLIPAALKDLGLDTTGLVIKDGSGESADNAVPPLFVSRLLVKIRANEADLGVIYTGMPVGGETGDLYDRFTGANEVAKGKVVAKPGWIDNERSLAGVINAADGTPLTFAFYGMGETISFATREALDTLTTAAYTCGNNLSNN